MSISAFTTLAFWQPGPQEMMIVGVIALLLFGKRLPEVARNLGRGFSEFKRGMTGFQDEVRSATQTTPRNYLNDAERPSPQPAARKEEAVAAGDDGFQAPRFDLD